MRALISFRWIGMVFYLVTMAGLSGQVAASSPTSFSQTSPSSATQQPTSSDQSTLLTFQQNQQALAQSFRAFLTLNPTPQQLQAWQQQNATALANQQQLALDLGADSALQPQPTAAQPNIPANASPTLKDFLTTQATLANTRAQIHNQLLSQMPAEVDDAQLAQMQQNEAQQFQQQQTANLQLQAQRAQTLANEAAQQPLPLPPPLVIPPGTSPQLAALLTAKDQLMRDQITFSNQYVTATASVRNAALAQWMQQNASRFQQMQQLAQNLSPTPSTTSINQN